MTLQTELRRLIDELRAEEDHFLFRWREMHIDQQRMDERCARHGNRHGCEEHDVRLRTVHQAMMKVHRKIAAEHSRVLRYYRSMASRLQREALPDRQIYRELETLRELLERMRREHRRMEEERQRIVSEHNDRFGHLNSASPA